MFLLRVGTVLATLSFVTAWPQVMEMNEKMQKREEPPPRAPLFQSGRQNTGIRPALGFDAREQFVNVTTGSGHEWIAPGSGDRRGECPGLNAA